MGHGTGLDPGFYGTQNYVNNAIGTSNALINQGGLGRMGNQYGQQALNDARAYGDRLLATPNPYLKQYYNAASIPLTEQYKNTVAPNLLANFAGTGTVGGTGMANAFDASEKNLAQGLSTLGANIYEPAYAQAQQLAAGLYGQGLGLRAGLQGQGIGDQLSALSQVPSLTGAAYMPSQMMMQAGALGQNQLQNIQNTAYQNLYNQGQWPYQNLQQLGAGLGNYPGQGTTETKVTGGGSMK